MVLETTTLPLSYSPKADIIIIEIEPIVNSLRGSFMNYTHKLGVIGYGNMAEAIVGGILKSVLNSANEILVYDVSEARIAKAEILGLCIAKSIAEICSCCPYILLSVKPQVFGEIAEELSVSVRENVVISIMAGVSVEKLSKNLSGARICRCMPNTPALIGEGITAIDSSMLGEAEKKYVFDIFNSVGKAVEIGDELMNAVTAVSGSGPAYVYLFIKTMVDAAVRIGLSAGQAKELVIKTLIGASKMAENSAEPIDTLIDRVCSKGGTTIEGIKVLKEKGLPDIIGECVRAAYNRAEELSRL